MQNPAALIVCAVAIVFIIVGFKGKTDNVIAAATGKPYGKSSLK